MVTWVQVSAPGVQWKPINVFDSSIHNIKAKPDTIDVNQVSFVLHYVTAKTKNRASLITVSRFTTLSSA